VAINDLARDGDEVLNVRSRPASGNEKHHVRHTEGAERARRTERTVLVREGERFVGNAANWFRA